MRNKQPEQFRQQVAEALIENHARRITEAVIANSPSFGDYPGEKKLKLDRRSRDLARLLKDAGKDAPEVIEVVLSLLMKTAKATGYSILLITLFWLVLLIGMIAAPENSALSTAFGVYTGILFIPWLALWYVAARRFDMRTFVEQYSRQSIGVRILSGGLVERTELAQRVTSLSPRDFEEEVARLYEQMGYEVERGSYVSDFGADLLVRNDDDTMVVQVKRWKRKVGRPTLQKLQGSSSHFGGEPVLVTTSSFTGPAIDYASIHGIELIDGEQLLDMLMKAYHA